jgi:hypothetical protein
MSEITTPHSPLVERVVDLANRLEAAAQNAIKANRAANTLADAQFHHAQSIASMRGEAGLLLEAVRDLDAYPALIAERDALRAMLGELCDDLITHAAFGRGAQQATCDDWLSRVQVALSSCPATGEGR